MVPRPVTWLLVVLTSVLLPLAMVSTWVAGLVSETDRYVETVAPLADDEVVVEAAHDRLEQEVLRALGAPLNTVPGLTGGIDRGLTRILAGPEFPPAWREANRRVHIEALRVLEDRAPVRADASGRRWVQLDLAPLVDEVLDAVERELGIERRIDISGHDLTIDLARESDVAQARGYYSLLRTAGFWLPVAWLALVVATVLTARRRFATAALLVLGALVALGLLATAMRVARHSVVDTAATDANLNSDLIQVLWDTLTRGLSTALWSAIGIATSVLVLWVALHLARRSRSRTA